MDRTPSMTLYRVDWTRITNGRPENASKLYRHLSAAQQLKYRLVDRGYSPIITVWTATPA